MPTVLEALCKGGADVNFHHHNVQYSRVNEGDTPLHIAINARIGADLYGSYPDNYESLVRFEYVEILILHGADVNTKNDAGRTPLHLAGALNNLPCARVSLQHGAKLDVKDSHGNTALMLAQTLGSKRGNTSELVAFLTEQEHEVIACTREVLK